MLHIPFQEETFQVWIWDNCVASPLIAVMVYFFLYILLGRWEIRQTYGGINGLKAML
jgi:hypothetical protein